MNERRGNITSAIACVRLVVFGEPYRNLMACLGELRERRMKDAGYEEPEFEEGAGI